jgi:hypothetical protein
LNSIAISPAGARSPSGTAEFSVNVLQIAGRSVKTIASTSFFKSYVAMVISIT